MKIILGAALALLLTSSAFAAGTSFDRNLSYSASGQKVIDLQNFLAGQGVYTGPITGHFFGLTKAALVSFQKKNGIAPASGFFGPLTRDVANSLVLQNNATSTNSGGSPVITQSTPANTMVQTLPPPTVAEIQAVAYLCSIPQMASQCTTAFWNGYATNAIFRNDIDAISQQLQQKLAQQESTAQTNCLVAAKQPYDPSITPQANVYIQQNILHACGLGPAPDQTALQVSQLQTQVQQLQSAIQQKQTQPTVQPSQPKQLNCTTQPWWNAGVLQYTTTCN